MSEFGELMEFDDSDRGPGRIGVNCVGWVQIAFLALSAIGTGLSAAAALSGKPEQRETEFERIAAERSARLGKVANTRTTASKAAGGALKAFSHLNSDRFKGRQRSLQLSGDAAQGRLNATRRKSSRGATDTSAMRKRLLNAAGQGDLPTAPGIEPPDEETT